MDRDLYICIFLPDKKNDFLSLFVSHDFKNPRVRFEKLQIWPKIKKICQNHQKSTNISFCDNSFDRCLVLILKYTYFCKFYDCPTIVYDTAIFWIWKKQNGK